MTKGDAGQNISKFASSSTEPSRISISMPYISYVDLADWLNIMFEHALESVNAYFNSTSNRTPLGFKEFCENSSAYSDVFVCDSYRLCRSAKLLMSLGYGNFVDIVQYDIFAMAMKFTSGGTTWSTANFKKSSYALLLSSFEATQILNSPNLSLFPLLAYHKICNDHYRNEKWQPFEPWTCNIDYLSPTDNMNAHSFIQRSTFNTLIASILDLENSNLPMDYFTSVLPRTQYGDASAVPVGLNNADATLIVKDAADPTKGVLFGSSSYTANDTLMRENAAPTPSHDSYVSRVKASSPAAYRDWETDRKSVV